jgi:hypothetical protein
VSYSLGFNRYHDHTTGESFWGDFDQKHTINAYTNYRATDRLSFSARFRAGSNFPVTGYWMARDGGYFVGDERNTLRVPVRQVRGPQRGQSDLPGDESVREDAADRAVGGNPS